MAGKKRHRGASRGSNGSPAWLWLLTGILIGLGAAYYLWAKGYIPAPKMEQPVSGKATPQSKPEPAIADEVNSTSEKAKKPRYDFFTVLPEMEVIVPEQELSESGSTDPAATRIEGEGSYLLQVGSFRQADDAEQMKARLALLGIVARIQTVTVNDATWHRVRIGPVEGARKADDIRQQLTESGIDSLVMKNP
jgi:cell division protein FtsN